MLAYSLEVLEMELLVLLILILQVIPIKEDRLLDMCSPLVVVLPTRRLSYSPPLPCLLYKQNIWQLLKQLNKLFG